MVNSERSSSEYHLSCTIAVLFCLIGYYVNRNQSDPAVAMVLYTILALDFIVPTLIFVINECSARLENKRRRAGIKKAQYSVVIEKYNYNEFLELSSICHSQSVIIPITACSI